MKALQRITGYILILCLNTACAEKSEEAAPAASADSPAPVTSAPAVNPDPAPAPAPSAGMSIPVDGTSLETFDASLARIKKDSTAAEYTTLTNAIDYLLVYNLSAGRDRTKLAALLNGETAEQIIAMVDDRKHPSKAKQ
ncbi:MAG: hypothetical protein ACREO9_00495, partial [Lysobacterales bacterium]